MSPLKLVTSPAVRSVLPAVNEFLEAIGYSVTDDSSDELVALLRKLTPIAKTLSNVQASSVSGAQLRVLLGGYAANMSDGDLELWANEVRSGALNDETLLQFVKGAGLKEMAVKIFAGNTTKKPASLPSFDPETGIFNL